MPDSPVSRTETSPRRRGFVVNGQRLSCDPTWFEPAVERAVQALAEKAYPDLPPPESWARAALLAALEERP
jgi:hypothetical protein